MNLPVLALQNEKIVSLCAVCVSDRNGGQIALLIIVSTLILFIVFLHVLIKTHPESCPSNTIHI